MVQCEGSVAPGSVYFPFTLHRDPTAPPVDSPKRRFLYSIRIREGMRRRRRLSRSRSGSDGRVGADDPDRTTPGQRTMPTRIIQGPLEAKGFRFAVVASRFNEGIVSRLVEGAVECLAR